MPSTNGDSEARWSARAEGPIQFEWAGGQGKVWNPRHSMRYGRHLSNSGGAGTGLWVELSGPGIDNGIIVPRRLDVRSGLYTVQEDRGKRLGVRSEVLGVPFEVHNDLLVAAALEVEISAGFVNEFNYELRRALTPKEVRKSFEAFKEAHVSLAIWADASEGCGDIIVRVYAGQRDNLAYEEETTADMPPRVDEEDEW